MQQFISKSGSVCAILMRLLSVVFALGLVSCGGGTSTGDLLLINHTVDGDISGLTSGTLVLKNNGTDTRTISANSTTFTFTTTGPYNVTSPLALSPAD